MILERARMLGLSGDQVVSLAISKYLRDDPTQTGDFKVGQLPERANATDYVPDFYVEATNGWVHYPREPIDSLGTVYQAAFRAQHE